MLNKILSGPGILIPFLLLLMKNDGDNFNLNINNDKDLDKKVDMLETISPYFSEREQIILSKTKDILDVVNKINRVRFNDYEPKVSSMTDELPSPEKKAKILSEMAKLMEGKNRELIYNVLEAKDKIEKTRSNLTNYKSQVTVEKVGKIDSMLNLMNCLKPVMHDKTLKKVKKMEKIVDIMKKPDDEIY